MMRYRLSVPGLIAAIAVLACCLPVFACHAQPDDPRMVSFVLNPARQTLVFCWKDDTGQPFLSLGNLKSALEAQGKTLVFAMNGGMYTPNHAPQGLFIQEGVAHTPLDTASGKGNFYLKPNGVFYLTTDNRVVVCPTEAFPQDRSQIRYATQSGPMLVTDGRVHPAFRKGSENLHIRNGVGILPDGQVLFAMSREQINLYDFAEYFRRQGCREALYLDGYVSRMYVPASGWEQLDGTFGVILAVTAE